MIPNIGPINNSQRQYIQPLFMYRPINSFCTWIPLNNPARGNINIIRVDVMREYSYSRLDPIDVAIGNKLMHKVIKASIG